MEQRARGGRIGRSSWLHLDRLQAANPNRRANCRNGNLRAERLRKPIIAPSADDGFFGALLIGLENKSCVIVEIASEAGAEAKPGGIEPLAPDKPKPHVETIENCRKIKFGIARERAQFRGSAGRLSLHAQKLLDHRALLGGKA